MHINFINCPAKSYCFLVLFYILRDFINIIHANNMPTLIKSEYLSFLPFRRIPTKIKVFVALPLKQ